MPSSIVSVAAFVGVIAQVFGAPPAAPSGSVVANLPDGLPLPKPQQLMQIEQRAHGMLPNGSLPSNLTRTGIAGLQEIAFHEQLEVAFFTQLVSNISRNVPGYEFPSASDRGYALKSLTAIQGVRALSSTSMGIN